MVQSLAARLGSMYDSAVLRPQGTDVYGIAVSGPAVAEVRGRAEMMALHDNVHAVMSTLEDGRTFIGFARRPQLASQAFAKLGRQLTVIGANDGYGTRAGPLYRGTWNCVGNECLHLDPLDPYRLRT